MKKRFSIARKPYVLFYAFSFSGIIAVWLIPFFQNALRAIWIISAPLIVGAYLQFVLNGKGESSDDSKIPAGIYVVIGTLFASVVILIVAILFIIGVL